MDTKKSRAGAALVGENFKRVLNLLYLLGTVG